MYETHASFDIEYEDNPPAKGRPRFARLKNGRVVAFSPKKSLTEEKRIRQIYLDNKYGCIPKDVPVKLEFIFYMKIPTSLSKKKKRGLLYQMHTKKPDLDNLIKLVSDALNKVAWYDDSQIVSISAEKRYAKTPYTHINILYQSRGNDTA